MFAKCVQDGACNRPSDTTYYDDSHYADHPVVFVTWTEANAHCSWADRRLPTEAEWEKAASWDEGAKTKRTYPWGETIDCSYANHYRKDGGSGTCVGDTTPVGSYESGKSPYGLYDMAGNVWEWVSSPHMPYLFDANDGREDMSSADPRVLRGGAWNDYDYFVRSASRNWYNPTYSNFYIGFRCSRSP